MEFQEFRVGDLGFTDITRGTRLVVKDRVDGDIPLVTAGKLNRGIKQYIKHNTQLFQGINLAFDMSGNCFVHDYPFFADDNVTIISGENYTLNQFLYLKTVLSKITLQTYHYTNKASWNKVKNLMVLLPSKDNQPDWEYMDKYIEECKQEYIKQTEAQQNQQYQRSYELLNGSEPAEDPGEPESYDEFRVGDYFECEYGDTDIQRKHLNGKGHVVITAGSTDSGIAGKTDMPAKIFEKNTITIDMFGQVNYRNFDYKLVTHGRIFSMKPCDTLSENVMLYIATVIQYFKKEFSYTNGISAKIAKERYITLPSKNNQPDWEYMDKYIAFIKNGQSNDKDKQSLLQQMNSQHEKHIKELENLIN